MSEVVTLAGSAVVVAFMLGVAALLGFRKRAFIADENTLAALLADYEPGARIEAAAIDDEGRSALARLVDGRLLAARVMGDSVSVRAVAASAVRVRLSDGHVAARFADIGFPSLNMAIAAPPAWLAALGEKT